MAEQKKNTLDASVKMGEKVEEAHVKKVRFLMMELQDIKNNKGFVTLVVKSVEYLGNWLKKNKLLQNTLLAQPIDITF